jgi:cyclophilin family peptidyl-prolyl cis-trans isomerase
VPSEKRSRQRAAREARLAFEAQAKKRRRQIRNAIITVVVAAVIVGIVFLVSGNGSPKKNKQAASSTTTTLVGTTTTTKAATGTSAPVTSTTVANKSNAALQAAANKVAEAAGCPASTKTTVNTQKYAAAPAMTINTNMLYSATVVTTAGTFEMALNAKSDPITVNNFVFLAQKGYYHCVIFHRVIPNFMDQTGDPTGTGEGGPGYTITDENPAKSASASDQYPLGSVAMANTGAANSGGSQFFIVTGAEGEGLPNTYALFGRITSGMDVVDTINQQGSAAGIPPDVTQRIISVTIHES